jgi:hypothetical protein
VGDGAQIGRGPRRSVENGVPDPDDLMVVDERIPVQPQMPVTGSQNHRPQHAVYYSATPAVTSRVSPGRLTALSHVCSPTIPSTPRARSP